MATVPGVAAVIIASPWMKFIVAFPGIVDNFSLLPESSDLSRSSRISVGNRHGEVIGELFGAEGIDRVSVNDKTLVPSCRLL